MTQEDSLEAPLSIHFSTRSSHSPTGIYISQVAEKQVPQPSIIEDGQGLNCTNPFSGNGYNDTSSDDVATLYENTVFAQKLSKIYLSRNQRVLMRRAWESWYLTLEDLHMQAYILDQTAISVKMVGMRMHAPSQESANDASLSVLNKYILELMFLRLLDHTLTSAFDQWRFWGTKRKITSKKVLKFVRGWLTSRAAGLMYLWHKYVADVLRERSLMTRRILCCERRFKRVRCTTFSLILQCWRQKVTGKRRRRLWLTSITTRIANSALARALDTWYQSVSNNRSKIRQALKAVIVSAAASLARNYRSGKDAQRTEGMRFLRPDARVEIGMGVTCHWPYRVTDLTQGGDAQMNGTIRVGDYILSVAGEKLSRRLGILSFWCV